MTIIDALILGILQGITEFLPISSDGHLVIVEQLMKLDMEHLKSFDVLLHMGTLLAIIVYFWKDVIALIKAFFLFIFGKLSKDDPYVKLIFLIVIGTIPAVFAGLFLGDYIDLYLRSVSFTGVFMILMAFTYIFSEMAYKNHQTKKSELNFKQVFVIGILQAMALLPGISRSGSTISAAIFQGVDRSYAARFSFLLGLPAILGAGVLTGLKDVMGVTASYQIYNFPAFAVGFFISFIFGLISIWALMKLLKKHSLLVFAIYLLALGVVLGLRPQI
ncbi:MAG: undecaprenyl-diphosphatase UppP [Candidatus Gracilibacteria bacterium]|jgi:undecaprenyl-diphosphatase